MKVSAYRRLRQLLTRHFLLPARAVRPHRSLHSLGLNALERNEFYNEVEQAFCLSLDDRLLPPTYTLAELAAYVGHPPRNP